MFRRLPREDALLNLRPSPHSNGCVVRQSWFLLRVETMLFGGLREVGEVCDVLHVFTILIGFFFEGTPTPRYNNKSIFFASILKIHLRLNEGITKKCWFEILDLKVLFRFVNISLINSQILCVFILVQFRYKYK